MTEGRIVIHVREPRGTIVWLQRFLGVFVVVGGVVMVAMLMSGDVSTMLFGLLWGTMFAGIPLTMILLERRNLAQADFTLDQYGLQSAHGLDSLVPWEDITGLDWEASGTVVNDESLVHVVATRLDGTATRISSLGLRRSAGEVDDVEEQMQQALIALGLADRVAIAGEHHTSPIIQDAVVPADDLDWSHDLQSPADAADSTEHES